MRILRNNLERLRTDLRLRVAIAVFFSFFAAWILTTAIATIQASEGSGRLPLGGQVGWPLETHRYFLRISDFRITSAGTLRASEITTFGAIDTRLRTKSGWPIVIPVRPVFPGFVIANLVVAAVFIPPFFYVAMKPYRRANRGACPSCNYDLRGLPTTTCPECGHSYTSH